MVLPSSVPFGSPSSALVGGHAGRTSRLGSRAHWTLPGEARLIITPDFSHISAAIGNRHYDRLPPIAIAGATSKLRTSWIDGQPPVEISLSALDWCGLSDVSADTISDRIVTFDQIGMGDFADHLSGEVEMAQDATEIIQIAKAVIRDRAATDPSPMVQHVEALMQIVDETLLVDASDVALRMGLAPHALRRVALRQFGFPAKTLLTRRRFLRALDEYRTKDMSMPAAVAFGYFDSSHFLRDAKRFLGMTPRRFFIAVDQQRECV